VLSLLLLLFVMLPWLPHITWLHTAAVLALVVLLVLGAIAAVFIRYGERPLRFACRPLGRLPFIPQESVTRAPANFLHGLAGLLNARIGLVAFAGEALTQVPVTLDYPVVEQAVMDLKIGSLEDGTAIGSGLATAVNRLRKAPDKSKVILLLTDGENNKGLIDPRTAAATAAAFGIKVYTIGVGTIGEAPIPTGRGLGGFRYELLPVRIDEPLLREIAAKTGGRYFRARDSEALSRIFRQIDALEKTPIQVTRYTRYDEATRPLIALGLCALALELLVGSTLVVRVP